MNINKNEREEKKKLQINHYQENRTSFVCNWRFVCLRARAHAYNVLLFREPRVHLH